MVSASLKENNEEEIAKVKAGIPEQPAAEEQITEEAVDKTETAPIAEVEKKESEKAGKTEDKKEETKEAKGKKEETKEAKGKKEEKK